MDLLRLKMRENGRFNILLGLIHCRTFCFCLGEHVGISSSTGSNLAKKLVIDTYVGIKLLINRTLFYWTCCAIGYESIKYGLKEFHLNIMQELVSSALKQLKMHREVN